MKPYEHPYNHMPIQLVSHCSAKLTYKLASVAIVHIKLLCRRDNHALEIKRKKWYLFIVAMFKFTLHVFSLNTFYLEYMFLVKQ